MLFEANRKLWRIVLEKVAGRKQGELTDQQLIDAIREIGSKTDSTMYEVLIQVEGVLEDRLYEIEEVLPVAECGHQGFGRAKGES